MSRCVVVVAGRGRCTRQKEGRGKTTRQRLPPPTMHASHRLCADVRRGRLDHNKTPLPGLDTSKDSQARRSLSHAVSCVNRFEQPALVSFFDFPSYYSFRFVRPAYRKGELNRSWTLSEPRRYHPAPPTRLRAASSQHEKREKQRGREREADVDGEEEVHGGSQKKAGEQRSLVFLAPMSPSRRI